MANVLTNVIPQLLAQGLITLRENSVMPRLVNSAYSEMAAKKGSTIDIPIPTAISVAEVTAAATAPAPGDSTPGTVAIALDQWYEAAFFLTDEDLANAMDGFIPMQAAEAIKALGNKIDGDILNLYKEVPYYVGTPGTVPFSGGTVEVATDAKKILSDNLSPLTDRRYVMNTTTEASALNLRAFQDMSFSGSAQGIIEGKINRKLGFDWFMDQNTPSHTNGGQDGAYVVNGVNALASTSLVVKTGTGTILEGDIFTIAGDTQKYVVTADSAGGAGTLAISPGLAVATSGDEAITFVGSASATYAHDIAFHRDAFAFVSRPLADQNGLGNLIQAAVDPVSGIALRLEVSREFKQTRYSYDILYGVQTIRKELACRVYGA